MALSFVVGYQQKTVADTSAGGYTWAISTLPSVGSELAKQMLGSWKVTAPEGGLWGETSVWLVTFDSAGQIKGNYCYLDDNNAAMMGVEPGWYTYDSVAMWAPEAADETLIPFGEGVQIASDCGATVTFAGEVASDALSFVINDAAAGGYTWTGNTSPVDLALEDITITPPEGGLWGETSIWLVTFDAEGQIDGNYCYLDENNSAMMGVDVGWYTYDSVAMWAPESAGKVTIHAGQMVQVASDCGATVTIPSALK